MHSHSHPHSHEHAHASPEHNKKHYGLFIPIDEEQEATEGKEIEKEEENVHFATVVQAFALYEPNSHHHLRFVRNNFGSLDEKYKKLISQQYEPKFEYMKAAIQANYNFILHIINNYVDDQQFPQEQALLKQRQEQGESTTVEMEQLEADPSVVSLSDGNKIKLLLPPTEKPIRVSEEDLDKVRSTLKQFVRDWGQEGAEERERCYGPILEELQRVLPLRAAGKKSNISQPIRVLTPGAGLGRLTFEIAKLGYHSQGNEFSFFMLLASNLVLNEVDEKEKYIIYPFIHQRSNVLSYKDQLRGVRIPDECTSTLSEHRKQSLKKAKLGEKPEQDDFIPPFSMVAGDFNEVYGSPQHLGQWDSVVTCFFIDTAKNIFEYIETINKCLKPGGVWINYGPLLYHFAEMDGQFSIELTYDELRQVILKMGFEIKQESLRTSSYTSNTKSMLQVVYKCVFFTAVKIK